MKLMPIEMYSLVAVTVLFTALCVVLLERKRTKITALALGVVTILVWLYPDQISYGIMASRREVRSAMHNIEARTKGK